MRGWFVSWVVAVAWFASGCAQTPGDSKEVDRSEKGCESLRVSIDSPAADAVFGTWSAQVEGRIESASELRSLVYDVGGIGRGLPAIAGPFRITVGSDRRSEVKVAIRAQTVDGCTAIAERIVRFDTTRWVDLLQDEMAEVVVEAPGDEVVVHWKAKVDQRREIVPEAWERNTRRLVQLDSWGPEGTTRLTVTNPDMEVWDFDLGVSPPLEPLVILVGTSLRMVPSHATIGVGEGQWITIPNATDAEWTVEPAAMLEPEMYARTLRAGMRFEAQQPGTYTVRAKSADGKRVGEATIEVKAIEQAPATVSELPALPDGFWPNAVVALPDGSLVAGGEVEVVPALLRLPRGGKEWTSYADVGAERRFFSHLVVGAEGELFALTDAVLRISPDGTFERILEVDPSLRRIDSIWSAGGTLYAGVGFSQTYAFNPAAGNWVEIIGMDNCRTSGVISAVDDRGLWLACVGTDWIAGPGFHGKTLAPMFDLALDEEGRLLAATWRGVHRLSGPAGRWEQMAGGGPSGEWTVFAGRGRRLVAANRKGLWTLSRSDETWVRVAVPAPEWPYPFFVELPDGGIVMGDRLNGSGIVEVSLGE